MIDTMSALGYAKPWSVAPGERISFHLGSEVLKSAHLQVVRIRCADPDTNGPGMKVYPAPSEIDGETPLTPQPTHNGSYGFVQDCPLLSELSVFTVGCFLFPTTVGEIEQTIISRWSEATGTGWKLELRADGKLALTVSRGGRRLSVATAGAVLKREWIFISASLCVDDDVVRLHVRSLAHDGGRERAYSATAKGLPQGPWPEATPLLFAASWSGRSQPDKETTGHLNGKIDRPRLYAAALSPEAMRALAEALEPASVDPLLIGAWDFSRGIESDAIVDLGPNHLSGTLRRLPMRAATGANWTGQVHSWTEQPAQYGAVHFHDDDLEDAEWEATRTLTIPEDWRSGFYALQMRATNGDTPVESYVIFFVRPPPGKRTADVLLIAPTATYLAYANNHSRLDQTQFEVMADGLMVMSQDDLYANEHREFGASTYDTHADDSGVCYSSAARPILNGRPRSGSFNYVNDTHFVDWLEEQGIEYDVVTDEDMHRQGVRLLSPYRVVVTLTHPEYASREMLDALHAYQNGGGRHMYLGGNGFYWRIAFHPTKPGLIELRRGVTGLRSWEAEAGEGVLSFTGEPSGLWRTSGRAPQRLCGVGFSAQVFDASTFYRRLTGSFEEAASFVFEGVGADEKIGDFGLRLGGRPASRLIAPIPHSARRRI